MKRMLYRITFWCLVFTFSCSTAAHKPTDKDTAEIIRLTLERAIVAGEAPDYHMIKDRPPIVISSENLNPNWLPQFPGLELTMLDQQQIQERADASPLFLYLRFRSIQIKGEQAEVVLDVVQARGKQTKEMGFGGSLTIEYRKENGKWIGEVKEKVIA
ncbi:MAG: hypothetical protein ACJ74G_10220 [Blastocatellia bacterium]